MECSLKKCSNKLIDTRAARVEVKTPLPKESLMKNWKSKFLVSWSRNGDAVFHLNCWETLVKSAKARTKAKLVIFASEKTLIKEAAKTAEFHDSVSDLNREAKRVATLIQQSSHCVAFTGAGISTAAGIGDYRGKGGKWTEDDHSAIDVDSMFDQGTASPSKKLKVEEDSESSEEDDGVPYEKLRPTYTHEALYKLMQDGRLCYIISQNGDGLHGLSGVPQEQLSELHGNAFLETCEKCNRCYERSFYVMDDVASQYFEELEDYGKTGIKKPRHAQKCGLCGLCHRTGRKCSNGKCKGFLKDTIINFRDNLGKDILGAAEAHAQQCDLMLCLGTTLKVTPASDLVDDIQNPRRLVICNRQKTDRDGECLQQGPDHLPLGARIYGDCDTFFREVMRQLLPPTDLGIWEGDRGERMKNYDEKRKETA